MCVLVCNRVRVSVRNSRRGWVQAQSADLIRMVGQAIIGTWVDRAIQVIQNGEYEN